ncbi:hypothetical protein JG688_00016920 [Phytophthora aleatoria]|uniref:Uncharacterized protein n=1 Tax=Phytophthora aleatoria TaxID=2496075 RepID=A0A8J5I3T9_9STRA|nr:hypothetical protein JG688_00016920 [Phytophthora aleatoria]
MRISYGLEEDWACGMVVIAATTLMPDSDREDCAGLNSSGRWKAKLVLFTEKAGVAPTLVLFAKGRPVKDEDATNRPVTVQTEAGKDSTTCGEVTTVLSGVEVADHKDGSDSEGAPEVGGIPKVRDVVKRRQKQSKRCGSR